MLKVVLLLNALSCIIFGAMFSLNTGQVVTFIGNPPHAFIQILGLGLVINGMLLILTAFQTEPKRRDVICFSLGDAAWVIFTGALLLGGIWIRSGEATYWSLAVAIFVGICGALQWFLAPQIKEQI